MIHPVQDTIHAPDCAGQCHGCSAVGSCSERYVCKCLKITESEVIEAITIRGATTLQELRTTTQAGTGCNCCHRELQTYLTIYSSSSSPLICSAK